MKLLNIFFLVLFCIQLIGQDLPDVNSLFSIQPKWSYVHEDTNWYQIQFDKPHLNQYIGAFYSDSKIRNNYYYLLEAARGQTHNPTLIEGYFLHKINLTTGEPEWVHYDNFFSGNDFVETVFGGNMHFNQDGNIVVNGFKSLDSIKNIYLEGFDSQVYVNIMKDVIDDDNGLLIDHHIDLDTSRTMEKLHPGGFLMRKAGNNRQLKPVFKNVFEDGFVRNYLDFYDVNEEGIASDTPVFSYKHTTIVDFNAPFLSYGNRYLQLDENSGVALFGSIDQTQGNIPSELKLVFFDTSNSPEIVVTQERNITNLLPADLYKATDVVYAFNNNGHFYLIQKALTKIDGNFDQFIWMKWYDNDGNLIQEIDRLQVDGMDMDGMVRSVFLDDTFYFLCKKENAGPSGEDLYFLIKSDKDTSIQKLASFSKPVEFEEYSIFFNNIHILENNDVMMYLNINYPGQFPLKSNASFLCRYDGKDLGLTTTAIDEKITKTMFLSPNPATDYILLNEISDQTISNVSIVDVLGNTKSYDVLKGDRLEISDLIPGNYFLRYYQNGKYNVLPFVKI